MKAQISGESLVTKQGEEDSSKKAIIEIMSFRFGDAKSLAKAKEADKRAAKHKDDEEDDEPVRAPVPAGKRSGTVEEDYRFQITKQVEKSSPFLAQAYFSNSFKRKRHKYNGFTEAKVTFRKLGAHSQHPEFFFSLTFGYVYVVGYELQTQGPEPPTETVDFCFQTCEMSYRAQSKDGTLGAPNIKGWNFATSKEM